MSVIKKSNLRKIISKDIDEIINYINNKETAYYNGLPFRYFSMEEITETFVNIQNDKLEEDYLAFLDEKERVTGMVGYTLKKPILTGAEVYLRVLDTESKDIISDTADAIMYLCEYAFYDLGYKRLTLPLAGQLVNLCPRLEELGFVQEAILREERYVGGKYIDSIWMGLLIEEFRGQSHCEGRVSRK